MVPVTITEVIGSLLYQVQDSLGNIFQWYINYLRFCHNSDSQKNSWQPDDYDDW